MSAEATKILNKALKLSNEERADLAACLIASLDQKTLARIDPAWEAEMERRLHAIDSGVVGMTPWEEARKAIFRDA